VKIILSIISTIKEGNGFHPKKNSGKKPNEGGGKKYMSNMILKKKKE